MARTKKKMDETKTTLTELIAEMPVGEEEQANLEYVERNGMRQSRLPAYITELREQMVQLANVRQRIGAMSTAKRSPFHSLMQTLGLAVRQSFTPVYHAATIDELVTQELAITGSVNASVRKAVRHSRAELKQLEQYSDQSLQEYGRAKASMLRTNTQYETTKAGVEQFGTILIKMARSESNAAELKLQYRSETRKLQTLDQWRNVYASRVQFRLIEAPVLEKKEESLRTVVYELQRMGEEVAMFRQHVDETRDATTILQLGYQTIDALQQSFTALSDAETAYELIEVSSARRFAERRGGYSLLPSAVTSSKKASDSLRTQKPSQFEQAMELIRQPVLASETYPMQHDTPQDFLDELEPGLSKTNPVHPPEPGRN